MSHTRIAGAPFALCAALLSLVTGCGVFTGTKGPLPVGSSPSAGSTSVAPQGLQLGYVWQPDAQNLFPVMGVCGASHYGAAVLPGSSNVVMAAATGTPAQSWALLLTKDGALEELELPANTTTTLAAGVAFDSGMVFSPAGSSAALVSVSTGTILIVNGLPSKPQVATLHVPAGQSVAGVAVSDGGTLLAGVKPAGSAGVQVGFAASSQSFTTITNLQAWGGAAFLPASTGGSANESAVIADGKTAQLESIANVSGVSPTIHAMSAGSLLQTPVGVGISSDGKWAFVADSGKAQIVRVSLAAGGAAPSAIACACSPKQLQPITGNGMFSVTSSVSGQPAWILDTRTQSPRTFFVPALANSGSN